MAKTASRIGPIVWIIAASVIVFFFGVLLLLGFISAVIAGDQARSGNIALIPITGAITTDTSASLLQGAGTDSSKVVEQIEKAEADKDIKGVLFEINSPGGTPVASQEISRAIEKLSKPSVAWIREVGASGAYWIAVSCDEIVAEDMSVTGSIGVRSSYLDFSGFITDHNITYERLVSGKYKDMGEPWKPLTPDEKTLLQSKLDRIHDIFVQHVAAQRGLPEEEVQRLSTGEFFLGVEAQELGLVDELGGKDVATEALKRLTDLSDITLVDYSYRAGFIESLSQLTANSLFSLGQGIGSGLTSSKAGITLQ